MKLALSNIGWDAAEDARMYEHMAEMDFSGLEIAPTRLFPEDPYSHTKEAAAFAQDLRRNYGLRVCSMQSLWYGKTERLFGSEAERAALLDYTCRAIDFAAAMDCPVLVLGSPKNRCLDDVSMRPAAVEFFQQAANYADTAHCTVALEPNPVIYGTNFINTTAQAGALCRAVGMQGFGINLDFGTIIENDEQMDEIEKCLDCVVHVHISEPNLVPIQHRPQHVQLRSLLEHQKYEGYVSEEMKNTGDLNDILNAAAYLREVFS